MDLVSDTVPSSPRELPYAHLFRRQNVSIMPQCVSAWCRALGHRVTYASYYGQRAPESLLPSDLDLVFLCCTTQASGLAYALAKIHRRRGTRTVLGGPHARSFPHDALRFFDIVVGHCDRALIDEILRGHVDPPAAVSSAAPPRELPGVEERVDEVIKATFYAKRPTPLSTIPLAASQGCPYACDFCIDAHSSYSAREPEALTQDLRYIAKRFPGVLVAYTDPNFAVRFDQTLEAIEAAESAPATRYVMEASLTVLRESRLERLRRSGCVYVAPGVESWFGYRRKSGVGGREGHDKLDEVVARFGELEREIGGVQANFVLGTDGDRGAEPFDLTREFIRRRPDTFPTISIPTPYGGTPLHDQLRAEDRLLRQLPFAFYGIPFLSMKLRHYEAVEYYDRLIRVKQAVVEAPQEPRRAHWRTRFIHALRRSGIRSELGQLMSIREEIAGSRDLRAFHDGESDVLPRYYHVAFERKLGRYAALVGPRERIPAWDAAPGVEASAALPARAATA